MINRLTEARVVQMRRALAAAAAPPAPPAAGQLVLAPLPGGWVSSATTATGLTTQAQVANRTIIAPFLARHAITVDQVAISIHAAVAGSLAKVAIFAADAQGRPAALLAETGTIDCGSTGTKPIALAAPLSLQAGQAVWIGVRTSSTQTLRCHALGATPSLGFTTAATPANQVTLQRTEPFADPAAAWSYAEAQKSVSLSPAVLLRAA